MPQSLSNILVHLVFSTRDRAPLLSSDLRTELHPYMVGVLSNVGCPAIQVGGVEDHVHILFRLSRTITVADVVEKVKSSSSRWIKPKAPQCAEFAWQARYGAFSICANEVPDVVRYIQNQQDHHRGVSFQDEYRSLMTACGISWDEAYVWG